MIEVLRHFRCSNKLLSTNHRKELYSFSRLNFNPNLNEELQLLSRNNCIRSKSGSLTCQEQKMNDKVVGESSHTVKRNPFSSGKPKESEPFSHFISLPLAIHPDLVRELINFQNTILQKDPQHLLDFRIEKSVFNNPKTFHLTVLMLKLSSEENVNAAKMVLKSVHPEVINALGHGPIKIRLHGLECMKGSVSKAKVVYAKVSEVGGGDRLLRACDLIKKAYQEAGLCPIDDSSHLKLHATLMNVLYRRGKKKRDDYFDASGVFELFGGKDWGTYPIREAHLSQRFVYDGNGYYHCCASIPFH